MMLFVLALQGSTRRRKEKIGMICCDKNRWLSAFFFVICTSLIHRIPFSSLHTVLAYVQMEITRSLLLCCFGASP